MYTSIIQAQVHDMHARVPYTFLVRLFKIYQEPFSLSST